VKLRIKTSDTFGEHYDKTFDASKEEGKLGVKYTYEDEHAQVKIYILKDKLQIVREGDIKSTKLLKVNEKTKFTYKASYMCRSFEIFTEELSIGEKKIIATYSIYEGDNIVNQLTLDISEV
jgi:hypothetical protein